VGYMRKIAYLFSGFCPFSGSSYTALPLFREKMSA